MIDSLIVGAGLYGATFACAVSGAGAKCMVLNRVRTLRAMLTDRRKM